MWEKSGWHHFHLNYKVRWRDGTGLGCGYPAGKRNGRGSGQSIGEYFNERHRYPHQQTLAGRPVYLIAQEHTVYRSTHRHYDSLFDLWVDVTLGGITPWPPYGR